MSEESYDTYIEWKKWDAPGGELSKHRKQYFAKELQKTGVTVPARLLEIGFGKGEFLQWAKGEGFEVEGIEILQELVDEVSQQDVKVWKADPAAEDFTCEEPAYDLIVAFDVLEHLDLEQIRNFLRNAESLLTPGGKILLRYPNAGSPFGQILYHGDYTHKTAMTKSKMEQVLVGFPFKVAWYGNTARVIHMNSPFAFLKYGTFLIRNLCEILLGWAYYGVRVPMDMNSIAILTYTK